MALGHLIALLVRRSFWARRYAPSARVVTNSTRRSGGHTARVENAQIADRLDAFASLLELNEANGYSIRAYRRAAETIRAAPVSVAELVATGRVRQLRGIGRSIEAKLRELLETGDIAELAELERELAPGLIGLGRYLGLGAKRSVEIAKAVGVQTPEEFREAARAGRLRAVPGVGAKIEAQVLEALARDPEPRARRGLLLNRARELVGAIAASLGGTVSGDVRRWRDSCEHLAVVCAAADPEPVLARFAELPQVVAVIEQAERRALGLTVEGVPIELLVASDDGFGTALLRATGSAAYVEALEPLPEAADEEAVYARLGHPVVPAGAPRVPVRRRAAGARRVERDPRRSPLPHDVVGRPRERRGDGAGGARPRLRLPRDLRPHAGRRRRPRAHARRRPPPGRGDRRRQRAAGAVSHPARDRVRHPPRRPARPPRRRPRRARVGAGERPRRPADAAARR